MDHLYQLLCIPKPPALNFKDLNNGNYNQFLEKSMKSASSLNRDPELKDATSNQLSKLLAGKSNSSSNTLRTINQMFDEASKQCHFDRERDLIQWLQVCVTTAAQFGLDPSAAEAQISEKPVSNDKRGVNQSKPTKKPVVDDEDEDWDNEEYGYDRIGASDDNYCPTNDDAVVPSKQRPARKSSPKTNGTASSPPRHRVKRRQAKTIKLCLVKRSPTKPHSLLLRKVLVPKLFKNILSIFPVSKPFLLLIFCLTAILPEPSSSHPKIVSKPFYPFYIQLKRPSISVYLHLQMMMWLML
ncbi:unnamed protein product [Mucor hiemalis]